MDVKARHEELKKELSRHSHLYYVLDSPEISDGDYDALFREATDLERAYPDLLDISDSPTQKVGGIVLDELPPYPHQEKMLSLDNVFNPKEWLAFAAKLPDTVFKSGMWVDPKMDGLALDAAYENGIYKIAATRGDGETGEEITENVRTIKNLPLNIGVHAGLPDLIHVRGEVVIPRKRFAELNERQVKAGDKPYANPRNAAAGSIRVLDSRKAAARPLSLIVYGIMETPDIVTRFGTHSNIMEWLGECGFEVPPHSKVCYSPEEVVEMYEQAQVLRPDLPFEIDGMVAKANDLAIRKKIGFTSRAPKWAIAMKFPAEQAVTKLRGIDVQIGRTGTLTPVARLEPIGVGGVTVENATLHNQGYIDEKDIMIGDYVVIQRAGDVIPEVVRSLPEKRTGAEIPYVIPATCPECGKPTIRVDGEAATKCVNPDCPAMRLRELIHFTSKAGIDMDGIGSGLVAQMFEAGMINRPEDFFGITAGQIASLERQGDRSAKKAVAAIAAVKKTATPEKLFKSLGIKMAGDGTARRIFRHYSDMDEVMALSADQLMCIEDIGPEVAGNIVAWMKKPENTATLTAFKSMGLWPRKQTQDTSPGPLSGKKILFTGKLPDGITREKAWELAEAAGAEIIKSVSKTLDILVVGEKAGSKLAKAESLNEKAGKKVVDIMDFAGFTNAIGQDVNNEDPIAESASTPKQASLF